jgi:hypothetical protein
MVWLILLGIFSWCIYWHVKENRQLISNWKETMDERQSLWLSRFAWSRSIQLILALACSFLVIIFYNVRLDSAKDQIAELSARKPITVAAQPPAYYPPTTTATPAEAPQPAAPPIPSEPAAPATVQPKAPSVHDVFKPDEDDSQSAMDALKQRYEDMLVIHFFLDRCGKINKSDYYIIMAALSQDMASINAPGRMQHDVLTAAQGSYNEMYAKSPCDSVDLSALIAQYSAYIKALSEYSKR